MVRRVSTPRYNPDTGLALPDLVWGYDGGYDDPPEHEPEIQLPSKRAKLKNLDPPTPPPPTKKVAFGQVVSR